MSAVAASFQAHHSNTIKKGLWMLLMCSLLGAGEPVDQRRDCVMGNKGYMWVSRFLSRSDSSEPNLVRRLLMGCQLLRPLCPPTHPPEEVLPQLVHTAGWQSLAQFAGCLIDLACLVLPRVRQCWKYKCHKTVPRRAARKHSQLGNKCLVVCDLI